MGASSERRLLRSSQLRERYTLDSYPEATLDRLFSTAERNLEWRWRAAKHVDLRTA
jgi:hypothetical protein